MIIYATFCSISILMLFLSMTPLALAYTRPLTQSNLWHFYVCSLSNFCSENLKFFNYLRKVDEFVDSNHFCHCKTLTDNPTKRNTDNVYIEMNCVCTKKTKATTAKHCCSCWGNMKPQFIMDEPSVSIELYITASTLVLVLCLLRIGLNFVKQSDNLKGSTVLHSVNSHPW